MSKGPTQFRTGWVIKHVKGDKIWKQTYTSREEAMSEFNAQVKMIQKSHPTYKGENWKIDSFEYTTQEKQPDTLKEFKGE